MIRFFVCLIAVIALSAPYAYCVQTLPIIIVDEYGVGIYINPIESRLLNGVLKADPGPGGLPSVMTYDLTQVYFPALAAGDVKMLDDGVLLDVIRFNLAGTGGDPAYPASLLFYSDNVPIADAPADTPTAPTEFYTNVVSINEIGEEGFSFAFYHPDEGPTPTAPWQPGDMSNAISITYEFISDGNTQIPEPCTMLLLGSGLIGLAGYGRKKFLMK
jgi:hypothetical protein